MLHRQTDRDAARRENDAGRGMAAHDSKHQLSAVVDERREEARFPMFGRQRRQLNRQRRRQRAPAGRYLELTPWALRLFDLSTASLGCRRSHLRGSHAKSGSSMGAGEELRLRQIGEDDNEPLLRPSSSLRPTQRRRSAVSAIALVAGVVAGIAVGLYISQTPIAGRLQPPKSSASLSYSRLWDDVDLPRTSWPDLPETWPVDPPAPEVPAGRTIASIADPNDVCIISADTRPLEPYLRPSRYSLGSEWPAQDLSMQSATAYYNFWWAQRHGYRFVRYNSTPPEGWHPMWAKLPAIIDSVERCEFTVFFDGACILGSG